MKRLLVMIRKDLRDALTEKTSLMLLSVPVGFCLVLEFSRFDMGMDQYVPAYYFFLLCCLCNLAIVPLCVFPLLIAQEKEMQTVPVLYRMGVTERMFIVSKAVAAVLIELGNSVLIGVIYRIGLGALLVFLAVNMLITISMLAYGGIVGIYARDKNSCNVYSTAGVLIIMVIPVFSTFGFNDSTISFLAGLLPTAPVTGVLYPILVGESVLTGEILLEMGIMVFWLVAGSVIFYILYKKNGLRIRALEMK